MELLEQKRKEMIAARQEFKNTLTELSREVYDLAVDNYFGELYYYRSVICYSQD
jgi:hypothetical protein